jgi:hypothetical protein
MTALYSLDAATNPAAVEVLHSVFVDEMLHLALAANILNAIGGHPQLYTPTMLQPFPRPLPHSDTSIQVSLCAFGRDALELFTQIEHPRGSEPPPQGDCYETIGQFYDAIKYGICDLCDDFGELSVFIGDPGRQITDREFAGGRLVAVTDRESAHAALDLIMVQGEGASLAAVWTGDHDPASATRAVVAHYYRFLQLAIGREYVDGDTPGTGPNGPPIDIDWGAVRPMRPNPRIADHAPGTAVRMAMDDFNRRYCTLLELLEQTFNGQPAQLGPAIHTMFQVKAKAIALMEMAIDDDGHTAGPSFEYVAPDERH